MRALLALAVVLALPSAAQAAIIGSDLTGASAPEECVVNATCILAQDELDGDPLANVFSRPGTVTSFTVRHVDGRVSFVVLREAGDFGYAVVNVTNAVTGSGEDVRSTYTLRPGIHVRPGDFIGLALANGATVGARDAADEDTNLLELTNTARPDEVSDESYAELFLQAGWTPSAAYLLPTVGAVTAVSDPLAALKEGVRPTVRISPRAVRASRRYSVAITVTNPNGYRVRGRLSLRSKGLRVGATAFRIGREASTSVRVKLSRRARRRLARRRHLRVTARAFVKGPIGKAGRAKERVTIRAPRR